jgi:heptosyltransferase III
MAGLIKKNYPSCKVLFLGRTYTRDVINMSEHVDGFINYDEIEKLPPSEQKKFLNAVGADAFLHVFPKKEIAHLAKRAGVPLRVGTTNRLYHWFTCNKLVRLSRKNSTLHEAQLNFKLLDFLSISTEISLEDVPRFYGFTKIPLLEETHKRLIDPTKFNLILHPRSKGSAREWGLANFEKLILLLPKDKFTVFISGTVDDGKSMGEFIQKNTDAIDLTGKLSLQQFIAFINACDGLIAASTGPLHIAASLNKVALGLFSPRRPIHPGRWQPLGDRARALVFDEDCVKCREKQHCDCIMKIKAQQIVDLLLKEHEKLQR